MSKTARLMATVLLISGAIPASSTALTMIASDINDICAKSEWIVLAKVVKEELQEARDDAHPPSMCYTLQPLSRWDKNPAITPARICYLGDLISTNRLIVAGLRYPAVNETAVFFIKSSDNVAVVSPLVSWNQGHFEVKTSDRGIKSVYTSDSKAVCGFDARERSNSLDGAAADGLVMESETHHCNPMSITAFEEKVRQCLY